jgi:hypothetical protein
MTKMYHNRKNVIILALSVFVVLFLPLSLFSQGAVVGYADGNKHVNANNVAGFPTNAQPIIISISIVNALHFCNYSG